MNPQDQFVDLTNMVDLSFRLRYGISVHDLDISETPGYWVDRTPKIHPGHPLHGCLGCSGPFKATYSFFDPGRVRGKFASNTRTWRALKSITVKTKDGKAGE